MCNACGFLCCAYDGFSGCGCDHCPVSACWSDDEDDFDDDLDDFGGWGQANDPPAPALQMVAGFSRPFPRPCAAPNRTAPR